MSEPQSTLKVTAHARHPPKDAPSLRQFASADPSLDEPHVQWGWTLRRDRMANFVRCDPDEIDDQMCGRNIESSHYVQDPESALQVAHCHAHVCKAREGALANLPLLALRAATGAVTNGKHSLNGPRRLQHSRRFQLKPPCLAVGLRGSAQPQQNLDNRAASWQLFERVLVSR
jgi:hypothetical protein